MPNNKYSAGIILLLAGVVILLGKLGVFSLLGAIFWPLLVLIPGVLLHVLYFGRLLPAVALVPGGMLVVYALLFVVCNLFGWDSLKYLWPLFIFGVAAGLYEYYLFGSSRQRVLFRAALALAAASAVFIVLVLMWSWGIYAIAVVLIGAGAWMTLGRGSRRRW
ncbi:hypothetical protein [Paenibacillus harenae]|uniref:DUF5668 domain-containing protein n=1 Tax=Paenibacillus harenae TaxID=306543 RepID=A0ABT9U0R1_PAEHA|nr:hypothetical protein [Paenibacillus harenae]MDQ0059376.1 hypothetical protein [Paenibacillus harenae]MDQ0112842.1 hypothetical protein [Paenibacillus harenae]